MLLLSLYSQSIFPAQQPFHFAVLLLVVYKPLPSPHSLRVGLCVYPKFFHRHRRFGWKGLGPFRPGFSNFSLAVGSFSKPDTWHEAEAMLMCRESFKAGLGPCWCWWACAHWRHFDNLICVVLVWFSLLAFLNAYYKY